MDAARLLRSEPHAAAIGETGSVSLPSVTCAEDWKELLPLLSSSPLFAGIEELSLCLYKHDYWRIAGLQPILSGFPNVKTLVVTYPTTLVLSLFTTVPLCTPEPSGGHPRSAHPCR